MSESSSPDSPTASSASAGVSNGKTAASPVLSPGSEPSLPIMHRPAGPKSRRPPTQLLTAQHDGSASSPASGDEPPPTTAASVVRRPIGPKSRRPPTQLLQSQREAAASSTTSVDEATEEAEIKSEAEAEKAASDCEDADDICLDPVAEVQDEDVVAAPAPVSRPRNLPKGAVPMLPGFGGGGIGLLKPRLPRQQPETSVADPDGTTVAGTSPDSPAGAAEEPPKPRLRPARAGPAMPPPPSVAATDLLALRQQLRKTPAAAPKPSSPPQSPPSLSTLPRPASEGDSQEKKSTGPPPRPPPPVIRPKPRAAKVSDEAAKAASSE
ncbi:hypothetical protein BOX15_Mlig021627g1 [Macrostomum lignano]|uniref:Uncharacterized protein n=1 Tax=Macrostomum lignano TaxID=282301 RepID=A0A267DNW0_9PLAT|nr:hypothetical protein BOX15_Mlig021627g1 [Macrostomum lignano]